MVIGAKAVDGQLLFDDPLYTSRYLRRLDGERLIITFQREIPRRSLAQNALIWRSYSEALRRCAAFSGHTPEELHEVMKRRFLEPVRIHAPNGDVIGETYSTKRLTVEQASAYIDQVLALFASYGVDLIESA